jgi:cell division protein FtsA
MMSAISGCAWSILVAAPSDIAIFTEGSIRHTGVIPIAGDQVTSDIAMALRTPTQHAEEIKIRYACALAQLTGPDETIKVPSVGDRPPRDLSRQSLAEVVEPRYDELFTLIQGEVRRSGFEELIPAGVVLTGGTSKMEGVVELAEEIFTCPSVWAHLSTREVCTTLFETRSMQRLWASCCRVQKNFTTERSSLRAVRRPVACWVGCAIGLVATFDL